MLSFGCAAVFLIPQANEILLLGHKLTASEAHERGLVTRVFRAEEFQEKVKEIVMRAAKLPPKVSSWQISIECKLFIVYVFLVTSKIEAADSCIPVGDTLFNQ